MYKPNPMSTIPKTAFTIDSGAVLRKYKPMGIPTSDERTSRQAALKFTSRQARESIMIEMVEAAMATNGVAVVIPTTIASRGIAMRASPKPSAERVNVERKMMAITKRVGDEESISGSD